LGSRHETVSCPEIGLHKPRIKMEKQTNKTGQWKENSYSKVGAIYFTKLEKEHIIQANLTTPISKNELWKKYTGKTDHGRLLNWMRKLGYGDAIKQEKDKFVDKTSSMSLDKELPSQQTISQEVCIAQEQEAKIKALENELKLAKKS
jgi:hypothetical protein